MKPESTETNQMKYSQCQNEIPEGEQPSRTSQVAIPEGNSDNQAKDTDSITIGNTQVNVELVSRFLSKYKQEPWFKNIKDFDAEYLYQELKNGGRFIEFAYCYSLILSVATYSYCYLIKKNESTFKYSYKYTLCSLFLGWWGFWGALGPIGTLWALYVNCKGGKDVTQALIDSVVEANNPNQESINPNQESSKETEKAPVNDKLSGGEIIAVCILSFCIWFVPIIIIIYFLTRKETPNKEKQMLWLSLIFGALGLLARLSHVLAIGE